MHFLKATLLAIVPTVIATDCSGSFLASTRNDCPLPPTPSYPVEVIDKKGPAVGNFANTAFSFRIRSKNNCDFFVYPGLNQQPAGKGVRFRDLNSKDNKKGCCGRDAKWKSWSITCTAK